MLKTHTLGFFHEQSRPDRDNYIDVHLENVEPANQFNFDKMKTEEWIDTGRNKVALRLII